MIAALLLLLFSANQSSCLESAFQDIGRRSMEEAFLYNCFTMDDQKYKDVWDKYASALEICPKARESYLNDTADPLTTLTRVAEACQENLEANRLAHDSLLQAQERHKRREERKDAQEEAQRKSKAQRYFAAHRSEIRAAVDECLHLYETGLQALRITKLEVLDFGLYRLNYQGRDVTGALVQARQKVTLDDNRCVFEEDDTLE